MGYFYNETGPQEYYYQNEIVIVNKKYQCPTYCGVNHHHFVYYYSETDGMLIDKAKLGEKYKIKKVKEKK